MNIIIECKLPDDAVTEEYEIEFRHEAPHCSYCKLDMEFDCYISDCQMEVWHCPKCHDIEHCYPGDYGSYFVTMTEQEYQDYKAMEHQKKLLYKRYGTEHPRFIDNYWQRSK